MKELNKENFSKLRNNKAFDFWKLEDDIYEKEQVVFDFSKKSIDNQRDIEPEIAKLIDDYFWDLR